MAYEYTLHINGVQRKMKRMQFRTGVITQMVEDASIVGTNLDSFEIHVRKVE